MRREDLIRIEHMIDAAEAARGFVALRSRQDLDTDRMLLFAVTRALELVGEAASRLSEEGRLSAPTIPWSSIIGMRNRLIHGYFNIDTEIVWRTVNGELPPLLASLKALRSGS